MGCNLLALIVNRFRDNRQKHQHRRLNCYRGDYSCHDKSLLRELSLRCWCFWRLSRNRLTINATTHTFSERSFRDLSKNVWVVALIVYRFRQKRQKHLRLNSYRGDTNNNLFSKDYIYNYMLRKYKITFLRLRIYTEFTQNLLHE